MSNELKEINVLTYTKVTNVKYIRIFIDKVELFTSADIRVDLISDDNQYVETKYYKLENEDYKQWDFKDDSYILDYVKAKLCIDYTCAPEVTQESSATETTPTESTESTA